MRIRKLYALSLSTMAVAMILPSCKGNTEQLIRLVRQTALSG